MQATQSVSPRPGITAAGWRHQHADALSLRGRLGHPAGGRLYDGRGHAVLPDHLPGRRRGLRRRLQRAVTFTADATSLDRAQYLATPSPDAWFPIGGPSIFAIHVDAVSAGTWTLTPMAS